jgi:glycosyltransferase involved in cell wall biosynthesis
MRIVVSNTFSRSCGGIERYLSLLIPALGEAGHELAFLCELDSPAGSPRISSLDTTWCISEIGLTNAISEVGAWCPDLIYTNGISDPQFERMILEAAPAVHFAHDYFATCISGRKAFGFPATRVCSRPFGRQCLVNYFPRRCGGLSPITMWENYFRCRDRLELMPRYRCILVASEAMRLEYLRNGFRPDQVETLLYPVAGAGLAPIDCDHETIPLGAVGPGNSAQEIAPGYSPSHLFFAGRMVTAKGGDILLAALSRVAAKLSRPLILTMAGDGPARPDWEQHARNLAAHYPSINVKFIGWQDEAALRALFEACHLLVVPSIWPEPFGLIGPEAGIAGLPAVGFDVGGIREWLHDGINGFLASGDPPTSVGLADAITKCLRDPSSYKRLRRGARAEAMKFTTTRHMQRLVEIFEKSQRLSRHPQQHFAELI